MEDYQITVTFEADYLRRLDEAIADGGAYPDGLSLTLAPDGQAYRATLLPGTCRLSEWPALPGKQKRIRKRFQCASTRFSEDGRTAFVHLRVDRRDYEFAKSWAVFHAAAYPIGTAEDQLEGYLNWALMEHIWDTDWHAPDEIEALYPKQNISASGSDDPDDQIPF